MKTNYAIDHYEAPKQSVSIFDYVGRVVGGCSQFLVALKYQWYKLSQGVAGLIKVGAVVLLGFVVLKGSGMLRSRNSYFDNGTENALLGFSLAPAEPSSLRDEQVKRYVERYAKIAIEESKQFGVPASISMAQGIIESRCGESSLAEKNNNHFGIKCFSKNCSKGHCSNFTDDSHKDFFRKYGSAWESWREHSKFLSQNRYKSLRAYGNDYENWAKGLSRLGYATDKTYADKLIEVIEQYHLNDLDD